MAKIIENPSDLPLSAPSHKEAGHRCSIAVCIKIVALRMPEFSIADYRRKNWDGIEWRVIREILLERKPEQIMYITVDDGEVDGVFHNDAYIDARHFSTSQLADFIQQRASL